MSSQTQNDEDAMLAVDADADVDVETNNAEDEENNAAETVDDAKPVKAKSAKTKTKKQPAPPPSPSKKKPAAAVVSATCLSPKQVKKFVRTVRKGRVSGGFTSFALAYGDQILSHLMRDLAALKPAKGLVTRRHISMLLAKAPYSILFDHVRLRRDKTGVIAIKNISSTAADRIVANFTNWLPKKPRKPRAKKTPADAQIQ